LHVVSDEQEKILMYFMSLPEDLHLKDVQVGYMTPVKETG
jgi:hypothetical protein